MWTWALSVIQFATLPFDFKRSFTSTRFRCNFCYDKVFRLDSDLLKNLSDTKRSTFNSGAEQFCSRAETASKAAFLVWTEALSGTPSPLRFPIRYSVNTTLMKGLYLYLCIRLCSHCTKQWNGTQQKVYRIGLLFTLGTLLWKEFLLRNSTATLPCWKWNVPCWIAFWNSPSQVWTLLSEQKLQRNLVFDF